jgi:flagellar biosynthesis component FlhA
MTVPKSPSLGGLNTISKSITKQQENIDELHMVITHLKEIILKYETEILELQKDNKQRDILIKQYELKYEELTNSINTIWTS